jgi:hypothetical protein
MFRTISQTTIHYRGSSLSVGAAGRVRAGDRLPWVALDGADDNFTPLASLDWQLQCTATPRRTSWRCAGSGGWRSTSSRGKTRCAGPVFADTRDISFARTAMLGSPTCCGRRHAAGVP